MFHFFNQVKFMFAVMIPLTPELPAFDVSIFMAPELVAVPDPLVIDTVFPHLWQ